MIDVSWADLDAWSYPQFASEEERRRAAAMREARDGRRYLAAHSFLRLMLSKRTGRRPDAIEIVAGSDGKPFLSEDGGLEFNLTHSDRLAGVACAEGGPVGLDCERLQGFDDLEELVARVGSQSEIRLIAGASASHRIDLFFRLWTRKEAVLKAIGKGLSFPLENVTVLREDAAEWIDVVVPDLGRWSVRDIPAPLGFAAAVSAQGACEVSIGIFGGDDRCGGLRLSSR